MPRKVILANGAIGYELTEAEKLARESSLSADQLYKELDLASAPLDLVKERKIAQLDEACQRAIEEGFLSPSTGHFFRFNKEEDQPNFNQQMSLYLLDETEPEVPWKTENNGDVLLDRLTFFEVVREARDHKMSNIVKYRTLKASVHSKLKNSTVDSVNWE